MTKLNKYIFTILIVALFTSCADNNERNYQYFPDMYQSQAYEPYAESDLFPQQTTALKPAEKSIKRGWMPFEYADTEDGYQRAKKELKNPVPYTEESVAKGEELYGYYCAICHGDKGNGKGWLVKQDKVLGVPSYDDVGRAITSGSTYYVIYHGRNLMGSYASQMNRKEMWKVTQYVMKLKRDLEGKEKLPFEKDTIKNKQLFTTSDKLELTN